MGVLKMKMSELVKELSERIKVYGDAKIVLRNKNDYDNNIKKIFDIFFDGANDEFIILFK